MVLAFVNSIASSKKFLTAALAARKNVCRLASTSGIRIPGVSKNDAWKTLKPTQFKCVWVHVIKQLTSHWYQTVDSFN